MNLLSGEFILITKFKEFFNVISIPWLSVIMTMMLPTFSILKQPVDDDSLVYSHTFYFISRVPNNNLQLYYSTSTIPRSRTQYQIWNVRIRSAGEIMNYFNCYSMQADSLHACVPISVLNSFSTKMLVRQVGHVIIDTLFEKLTDDFSQIFQNFLEKNFKMLLYLHIIFQC